MHESLPTCTDIEPDAKRNKIHHPGAALLLIPSTLPHHAPTLCIPSYNLFKHRLQMGRGASETEQGGDGGLATVGFSIGIVFDGI